MAKSRKTPTRLSRICPITGPIVLARLKPALFRAIAGRSCEAGTISGMTACQAGVFMALPSPIRKLNATRFQAVSPPNRASTAMIPETISIQIWQPMM